MKICFASIATNKYIDFIPPLVDSIRKYVQIDGAKIDCKVFTNQDPDENTNCQYLCIDHQPWPLITLLRYHNFLRYWDYFEEYDYIFHIDADMLVCNPIGAEILGEITLTRHPGQFSWPSHYCTFERNPKSEAYVPLDKNVPYCINAFMGGTREAFKELCEITKDKTEKDLKNHILPCWDDESLTLSTVHNCLNHRKINYLDPGYCFPQGWNIPFEPKIMALDKNQQEIRS